MHPIKCACGTVKGLVLAGAPSNRVRCYCTDCRAFGRFLGAQSKVLDSQGGTEIIQAAQYRVRFTQGLDHVAAIQLSEKGMVRWYARCCNTPIGNTMRDSKWSFIGLISSCLTPERLDQDFGSAIAALGTDTALGNPKPKQHGVLSTVAKFALIVIPARLSGSYKDTQLFTSAGAPIAVPRVLLASEVEQLKSAA